MNGTDNSFIENTYFVSSTLLNKVTKQNIQDDDLEKDTNTAKDTSHIVDTLPSGLSTHGTKGINDITSIDNNIDEHIDEHVSAKDKTTAMIDDVVDDIINNLNNPTSNALESDAQMTQHMTQHVSITNAALIMPDTTVNDNALYDINCEKSDIKYNDPEVIIRDRANLKADSIRDIKLRERLYRDVNLPSDLGFRRLQGLSNSKKLSDRMVKEFLNKVQEYSKTPTVDIDREIDLISRFGILIKNINDYKRVNFHEITPKYRVDAFKRITDWEGKNEFEKTCITYGHIIPDQVIFQKGDSAKNISHIYNRYKDSIIFPPTVRAQPHYEGPKYNYCLLTFVYERYHVVLYNHAYSAMDMYVGCMPSTVINGVRYKMYLTTDSSDTSCFGYTLYDNTIRRVTLDQIFDEDLDSTTKKQTAIAAKSKEIMSALPKPKTNHIVKKTPERPPEKKVSDKKAPNKKTARKAKKQEQPSSSFFDKWIMPKDKPHEVCQDKAKDVCVIDVDSDDIVKEGVGEPVSDRKDSAMDMTKDSADNSVVTQRNKHRMYDECDKDDEGSSQKMIETYMLIRDMKTGKTKMITCYIKPRTTCVDIYIVYNKLDNAMHPKIYFVPFNKEKMTNIVNYFK